MSKAKYCRIVGKILLDEVEQNIAICLNNAKKEKTGLPICYITVTKPAFCWKNINELLFEREIICHSFEMISKSEKEFWS